MSVTEVTFGKPLVRSQWNLFKSITFHPAFLHEVILRGDSFKNVQKHNEKAKLFGLSIFFSQVFCHGVFMIHHALIEKREMYLSKLKLLPVPCH